MNEYFHRDAVPLKIVDSYKTELTLKNSMLKQELEFLECKPQSSLALNRHR